MACCLTVIIYFSILILTVAAASSVSIPTPRTHYAPQNIPSSWTKLGEAATSDPLEFTFVLNGADYSGLTGRMEQIALQQSRWLSDAELAVYVGPTEAAKTAVRNAIVELEATLISTSTMGDKITVATTVGKVS